MTRNREDNLIVLILAFFALLLYFNSFWNAFVYDDLHTIVHNLYVKDISKWPLFFQGLYTSEPIPRGMFRPLLMLTFGFNYIFGGLNPLGFHILNLIIHFLNGILLYLLIRLLKKDIPFALVLGLCLLFIAHPLNNEAVIYITCRSDLLVTFFVLLSFILYLKGNFLVPCALYMAALFTKETALIFPLLVFAYEYIGPTFTKQGRLSVSVHKKKVIFYIVIILATLFYWYLRVKLIGISPQGIITSAFTSPLRSFQSNILTQSAVTLFYLKRFILPYSLIIHHIFPIIRSFSEPLGIISLALVFLMFISIFFLRKKYPLISLGLAWYLICISPKFYAVLNVVAAEHHFYMPSIGLYIILVVLGTFLYRRLKRITIYFFYAVLAVFTLLVWFKNYDWRDSFSLWQKNLKLYPLSAEVCNNVGIEYAKKGFHSEAEAEFIRALSLSKEGSQVHLMTRQNLAELYLSLGRLEEAQEQIEKAFLIDKDYYYIYHLQANIYLQAGKNASAERIIIEGLAVNPLSSELYSDYGFIYLLWDEIKAAKESFLKAISCDPDAYIAYFGLAQAYEKESDTDSAIKAYRKSLVLNPGNARAHQRLGSLYAKSNNYALSLRELKRAISLSATLAQAYNDLAVVYASMEPPDLQLARDNAQKALALGYEVNAEFLKSIGLEDIRREIKLK